MHKIRLLMRFLRYFSAKLFSYLVPFRGKYREVWLFSERGSDAADNAWALFCYVRAHDPKRKCYYVLEKDASCLPMVKAVGKTAVRGSAHHLLLYFLPTVKISTHILGTSPDSGFFASEIAGRYLQADGKQVFLQHGILHADIPALHAENRGELSLFVSGSAVEYAYLRAHYGYSPDVLRYLGLARFDLLKKEDAKRQILFFPTWRNTLTALSAEAFTKTAYYRDIFRFLQDERLQTLLEAQDATLVFAPHFEMHRFAHLFCVKSSRIRTALSDVGALIRESAMLITDHSSVMFDFAYKEAPVLYANFKGLCKDHYDSSDFPLADYGFGTVCTDIDTLLSEIASVFSREFEVEEPYLTRMRAHFPVKDGENRKRNYEAIVSVAEREGGRHLSES